MTRRFRGRRASRSPEFDVPHAATSPREAMLSSQIEDALRLALAVLDDPRLDDAVLRDVAPDGAFLRATVECPAHEVVDVEHALARAMPRIKYELASEVHRKRLPNVRFVVVPAEGFEPSSDAEVES